MIQSADARSTRATTGRTDATLLDQVRRDPVDIGAFDELIDRYRRRLFARCQLLRQGAELAADLAQEAWCRVLRARRDLRSEQPITTWLRQGRAELRVPLGAWAVPTA